MNEPKAAQSPTAASALSSRQTTFPRPLSQRKQFIFGLLAAAGVYASIELVSLCVLSLYFGGVLSNQAWQSQAARANPLGVERVQDDIVHPYLGFVRRPRQDDAHVAPPQQVSLWGFNEDRPPIHRHAPGKVIIGVLGGSVAEQFANGAGQRLCGELQRTPQFAGKQIVLVHLALSGYKQPQQLLAVTWLLSLGAEFDVFVNIDGFNEVALPAVENVPNGVFASYPRSWHARVAKSSDLSVLRLVGRIAVRNELRQTWADRIGGSPARFSTTLNLLWRAYDDALWRGLLQDYRLLYQELNQNMAYGSTGPPQKFSSPDDLYAHCASVWRQSSLQLHRLAAANGIRYYHFLQPNQYVPGSKEMGPEERRTSFNDEQVYRVHVERGYPWLKRFGAGLAEQGVRFHDLTQLFAAQPQPTYSDACCHYNERGNDMLADAIASVILADVAVATSAGTP